MTVFYENKRILKVFGSGEKAVTSVLTSKFHFNIFVKKSSNFISEDTFSVIERVWETILALVFGK
jgi:hypothetical protein